MFDNGEASSESLAILMCSSGFGQDPPILELGIVLRDSESNYWLCAQPLCDSVRLTGKRAFPMLPLSTDPKNPAVIFLSPEEESVVASIEISPYMLTMRTFDPGEEDTVVARDYLSRWTFTCVDGRHYIAVARLRPEIAAQAVHGLASAASRPRSGFLRVVETETVLALVNDRRKALAHPHHAPTTSREPTASQLEPDFVGDFLVGWDPIVLCQRDQPESSGAQRLGDFDPSQAAVKEEVRQPVGMWHERHPQVVGVGRRTLHSVQLGVRRPRSVQARRRLSRRPRSKTGEPNDRPGSATTSASRYAGTLMTEAYPSEP